MDLMGNITRRNENKKWFKYYKTNHTNKEDRYTDIVWKAGAQDKFY